MACSQFQLVSPVVAFLVMIQKGSRGLVAVSCMFLLHGYGKGFEGRASSFCLRGLYPFKLPIVSIVVPFFGLTKYIIRIL